MKLQLSYLKSYKMMLLKCCTQYISKFGKLRTGHMTGKSQFSFQSQRRAMPKNVQTTVQFLSFHRVARLCSKSFKSDFSRTWTKNLQPEFQTCRGTRDQTANVCWIMEKAREFQKNIYFCFIDYTKAFGCVDHKEPWKILKEMWIPD